MTEDTNEMEINSNTNRISTKYVVKENDGNVDATGTDNLFGSRYLHTC